MRPCALCRSRTADTSVSCHGSAARPTGWQAAARAPAANGRGWSATHLLVALHILHRRVPPRLPPRPSTTSPAEEPCEGAHAGSLPAAGRANTHTPRRARRRLRNDSRAHAVGTGARAAHSWHGAGTHVEGVKLSEHGEDRMFFFSWIFSKQT